MEWFPGASLPALAALRKQVAPAERNPCSRPAAAVILEFSASTADFRWYEPLLDSGVPLSLREKVGKEAPKGTYFEAVPFGNPPRRRKGLCPLRIPTGELRRTRGGKRAFTEDGAVLISPGNSCISPRTVLN